jgi:hypothetical protein
MQAGATPAPADLIAAGWSPFIADQVKRSEAHAIRACMKAAGEVLGQDLVAAEKRIAALEAEVSELRNRLNQQDRSRGLALREANAGGRGGQAYLTVGGLEVFTISEIGASPNLHMGHDNPWFRWRRLHGVSPKGEASIDSCLIYLADHPTHRPRLSVHLVIR